MHPTLIRQLRRLCGVESIDHLHNLLEELQSGKPTEASLQLLIGLPQLIERIDNTYDQFDRDLELRSLSLEVSSKELNEINARLETDMERQHRALESVHQAISQLVDNNEESIKLPAQNDLEGLTAILPGLVAQQEQRRLELYYQRFAMDQHAIVSVADVEGNITYVNDKFCRISGYNREELLGQNHRLLKSGEHTKGFYETMWKTISSGRVWHGEIKNRTKQNSYYWVESTIVPFLNNDGTPFQYISIRTNVTHRHDLTERIKASENKYRTLVQNINQVIFRLDPQLNIIFLNHAWEELTGISIAHANYQSFSGYIHEEDKQKLIDYLLSKNTLDDELLDRESQLDIRLMTSQKKSVWVEIRAQQEKSIDGKIISIHGTITDIDQRKRMQKMQDEFISVVSHELRTPVTSIRGSLSLLRHQESSQISTTQEKLIDIASRNSERLVSLVNDILDMEKLMAGKMELTLEPVNLHTIIQQSVEAMYGFASQHKIQIRYEHPRNTDCIVQAEASRIIQVLNNFLSNACKFSPQGSQVEVQLTADSRGYVTSVIDSGCGIPPEFQERLFTPFAQANSSNTRQQGGTGLGLSISKTLIEKMSGKIGVDSKPNEGSRFWFYLPKDRRTTDVNKDANK